MTGLYALIANLKTTAAATTCDPLGFPPATERLNAHCDNLTSPDQTARVPAEPPARAHGFWTRGRPPFNEDSAEPPT